MRVASIRLVVLGIGVSSALFACEQKQPPPAAKPAPAASTASAPSSASESAAQTPKPSPPTRALRDQLVGTWVYDSVELPGTPAAMKTQIEKEMKKSRVEFKDGKFASYTGKKLFSSANYSVVSEQDKDITLELKGGKRETYTFVDDDTLSTTSKELGKIVMKRSDG